MTFAAGSQTPQYRPQQRSSGGSLNVNDNVTTTSEHNFAAFAASEMLLLEKEPQRKKERKKECNRGAVLLCARTCMCACMCRWEGGRSRLEIFILEKVQCKSPPFSLRFGLYFSLRSSTPFPAYPAALPSLAHSTPPRPPLRHGLKPNTSSPTHPLLFSL